MIGTDGQTGIQRFTFGIPELSDGIGFIAIAMGMFGITEIMLNLERPEHRDVLSQKVGSLYLTREETIRSVAPTLRGTALGSILGILPGGGAALASFASYMLERKMSKYRHEFGSGAIEGVAGPEFGEQCGGADQLHPDADAGHSGECRDVADDRRAHPPGHSARSADGAAAAGPVLGPHRFDVGRQPDAARSSTCR